MYTRPRLTFSLLTGCALIPLLSAAVYATAAPVATAVMEQSVQQVDHPSVAELNSLLTSYEALAAQGGWPTLPAGPSIKPIEQKPLKKTPAPAQVDTPAILSEVHDARIPTLRTILSIMGDYTLPEPAADSKLAQSDIYDPILQAAVKRFQLRHGLKDDGAIGEQTRLAMNTPVAYRIRQIKSTLRRIEQAPAASQRYIVVNIPEYMLRIYEDGKQFEEMKVIVGIAKRPTPRFDTVINYISFNPTWGVPLKIAAEELLPKIIEYPDFLSDHHYQVYELTPDGRVLVDAASVDWKSLSKNHFPYLLVQDAGDENALGKIKFGLKNSDGIYMHDTSTRQFFEKDMRSLSHGCVRVEKPRDLAHFVFKVMPKFTDERVDTLYDSDEPKIVGVKELPVHFVYWTAWVAPDGRPQFRKDIYSLD